MHFGHGHEVFCGQEGFDHVGRFAFFHIREAIFVSGGIRSVGEKVMRVVIALWCLLDMNKCETLLVHDLCFRRIDCILRLNHLTISWALDLKNGSVGGLNQQEECLEIKLTLILLNLKP